MSTLDLNVFSLYRLDGQDRHDLPGLYLATAPRRAARGREKDRLIVYFAMAGDPPLSVPPIEPLLIRLAQTYYKTPGSITAAMRAGAEQLNATLLDRNLRGSTTGRQEVGNLVIGVLREDRLTLAHCGIAHTFVITPQGTRHLFDSQGSRGLGLVRAVALRYYQLELHPNDMLVVASQPPASWTELTLQNVQIQAVETLRRRLLGHAGPNLSAILLQAQVGTGKLRSLRPKAPVQMATPGAAASTGGERSASAPQDTQPPPEAEIPRPAPPAQSSTSEQVPPAPGILPVASPHLGQDEEKNDVSGLALSLKEAGFEPLVRGELKNTAPAPISPPPTARQEAEPVISTGPSSPRPAAGGSIRPTSPVGERAAIPPPARATPRSGAPETPASPASPGPPQSVKIRRLPRFSLGPAGQAGRKFLGRLAFGLHTLLKRMLPDESLFSIPASTMAFLAVAVAVILATTGGAVYFQRGRQVQYQAYFEQALRAAQLAETRQDPNELRTDWETALDFLDEAEVFQQTAESKDLRQRAQDALDEIDRIQRLDFQPVLTGGLGNGIQVSRMIVTDADMYLLNSAAGNVIRAVRTGRGYEIDPVFECGPNAQIGPLIDIDLPPSVNPFKATIYAMDARGNLLACLPGEKPVVQFPNIPQPSEQGMRAFAIDGNTLYMLDPGNNAVWYYRRMEIDQPPHMYFGPDRPNDVLGLIDMIVTRDDLYLLHQDGYIVKCTFGGLQESPTRCEDPATFTDPRPGRTNGPVILDARFDQLLYSPPPDPSIYLLDPINVAIYHFGLRLTFQRQFRPRQSIPTSTRMAFTVRPDRQVFLAAGGQVYSAILP